jgi:hypothetical protein
MHDDPLPTPTPTQPSASHRVSALIIILSGALFVLLTHQYLLDPTTALAAGVLHDESVADVRQLQVSGGLAIVLGLWLLLMD